MAKIINDPGSPLHGMTLSSLPAEVYTEAVSSRDDIGVLLRSYYLVERACENLCATLYYDYTKLQHDSLSKHLRALRAFGFTAPVLRMADVISKHRGPGAHVRTRVITPEYVAELNTQSSGVLNIPGTLLQNGLLPTSEGQNVPLEQASLREQYAVLSCVCAGAIDLMAERRKPAAAQN